MTKQEWRNYLGRLLAIERVRGDIIFLSIMMEINLDKFLAGYFPYNAKIHDFESLILSKLTLGQKIDVLKNLKFRSSVKSFPALLTICNGLNRLRNHAAHVSWTDQKRVAKLADDQFVRELMLGYPGSINATRERILRLTAALSRTCEFKMTEYPDDDIPF